MKAIHDAGTFTVCPGPYVPFKRFVGRADSQEDGTLMKDYVRKPKAQPQAQGHKSQNRMMLQLIISHRGHLSCKWLEDAAAKIS